MSEKRFTPIDLDPGERPLPAWVKDAHINWMEGFGNSPHLHVRCRHDPLAFANFGNPVWEKRGSKTWIAEHEGVASVHYHNGAVSRQPFIEHAGWIDGKWNHDIQATLDGEPRFDRDGLWADQPSKPFMGGGIFETRHMLATTQQEGYAGRHIDITLKNGDNVRLRGPWHGGAPEGYSEVYYYIDRDEDAKQSRRWWKPWYKRGGYFGLHVRTELLLDIFATYQPHVPWGTVTTPIIGGESTRLEPLRPETGLPKGFYLDPDQCPGHRFSFNHYQTGPQPYDRCDFCEVRRDPSWVSPYERKAAA